MKNNIAIIMSTYNGESYIKEQLLSIANQEKVNYKLFIRDDGSKDDTIKIINGLKNKMNIELIKDENIGAGKSFMILLKYVLSLEEKFDYYAFADQDDIWFKDKLISAIKMINKEEPLLYCCNQIDYKNKKPVGESKNKGYIAPTLKQSLLKCDVPGCTYVFNKAMANKIEKTRIPIDEFLMYRFHDTWIYSVACIYGKIVYDEKPHIYYRIHEANTSMKKVGYIKKFILSFSKTKHRKGMRSLHARQLLEKCDNIKQEDIELLKKIGEYRNNIKSRFTIISDKEIPRICNENILAFYLKVLTGFF